MSMAKLRFKSRVKVQQLPSIDSPSNDDYEKDKKLSESPTTTGTSMTDQAVEKELPQNSEDLKDTTTGERPLSSDLSNGPIEVFGSHHEAADKGCPKCGNKLNPICAMHAWCDWTNCCGNCQTKIRYRIKYNKRG